MKGILLASALIWTQKHNFRLCAVYIINSFIKEKTNRMTINLASIKNTVVIVGIKNQLIYIDGH